MLTFFSDALMQNFQSSVAKLLAEFPAIQFQIQPALRPPRYPCRTMTSYIHTIHSDSRWSAPHIHVHPSSMHENGGVFFFDFHSVVVSSQSIGRKSLDESTTMKLLAFAR
jgi:hypothetical protein